MSNEPQTIYQVEKINSVKFPWYIVADWVLTFYGKQYYTFLVRRKSINGKEKYIGKFVTLRSAKRAIEKDIRGSGPNPIVLEVER